MSLRHAFFALIGLFENSWRVPALHQRVVLTDWCNERHLVVGGRVETLLIVTNAETGRIDLEHLVPFVFTWSREPSTWPATRGDTDEDDLPILKKVKYVGSDDEVMVKGMRIDPVNWRLDYIWSDIACVFANLENKKDMPDYRAILRRRQLEEASYQSWSET